MHGYNGTLNLDTSEDPAELSGSSAATIIDRRGNKIEHPNVLRLILALFVYHLTVPSPALTGHRGRGVRGRGVQRRGGSHGIGRGRGRGTMRVGGNYFNYY